MIDEKEKRMMSKTKISPRGSAWDKFEKQLFTPEEIEASNMRISSIIKSPLKTANLTNTSCMMHNNIK